MASSILKAVRPSNIPSSKEYMQGIDRAYKNATNATLRDYKATVSTWDHKVDFDVIVVERGDDKETVVGTDDKIYGYVNDGTEPHIIRARNAPYLSFPWGGSPKTRPGVIGSRAGSQGDQWSRNIFVFHPGTKPRKFSEAIAKRRQKTLLQETSQNIAKVARKQA